MQATGSVARAAARAAFSRLQAAISPVSPANFLALEDARLKAIGFSRQKMTYGRILAQAVLDGQLDMDGLLVLSDDSVRAELTKIKGIGRWSADIYLMEALLRPDIWPAGDLALVTVAMPGDFSSAKSRAALGRLRGDYIPLAFEGVPAKVLVGGPTAETVDAVEVHKDHLPQVFGFVLGSF